MPNYVRSYNKYCKECLLHCTFAISHSSACKSIEPCKPAAEVYTHFIVHYSVQVCLREKESFVVSKICPKHISRVRVVVSASVCLLNEESFCEALAGRASLAGQNRGDLCCCILA